MSVYKVNGNSSGLWLAVLSLKHPTQYASIMIENGIRSMIDFDVSKSKGPAIHLGTHVRSQAKIHG